MCERKGYECWREPRDDDAVHGRCHTGDAVESGGIHHVPCTRECTHQMSNHQRPERHGQRDLSHLFSSLRKRGRQEGKCHSTAYFTVYHCKCIIRKIVRDAKTITPLGFYRCSCSLGGRGRRARRAIIWSLSTRRTYLEEGMHTWGNCDRIFWGLISHCLTKGNRQASPESLLKGSDSSSSLWYM